MRRILISSTDPSEKALRDIVQSLEKQSELNPPVIQSTQRLTSNRSQYAIHNLKNTLHSFGRPYVGPYNRCKQLLMRWPVPKLINDIEGSVFGETRIIGQLDILASRQPYYKFNYSWTRQIQDAVGLDGQLADTLNVH